MAKRLGPYLQTSYPHVSWKSSHRGATKGPGSPTETRQQATTYILLVALTDGVPEAINTSEFSLLWLPIEEVEQR